MATLSHFKTKAVNFPWKSGVQIFLVWSYELQTELAKVIIEAKVLRDITAKDHGTCVLGAGIQISFMENGRKKYPTTKVIIPAPFQGNVGSYQALKPCLEYIQRNYPQLHAVWHDGRMD